MNLAGKDVYGMAPSRSRDYAALRLQVIRDRWDRKADRWDADLADRHFHLNEDGGYRTFLETADSIVARRADFCRKHALVDLGCGTGLVLEHFLARFAEGIGIDISLRMLEIAASRNLPRAKFIVGNCFSLARYVERVGAVLARGILLSHYGRRWMPLLLRQIYESLLPGGLAILDFLNAAARERFDINPNNKTYFHEKYIEIVARRAGFRHVEILGESSRRTRMVFVEK